MESAYPSDLARAVGCVVLEASDAEDSVGELIVLRTGIEEPDPRWWRSGEALVQALESLVTFFTSRCTMYPGCFAVIVWISRFVSVSPFGSMNRRRFRPSWARCRVIVRRLTATPSACSSRAMRDADHLCPRRSLLDPSYCLASCRSRLLG